MKWNEFDDSKKLVYFILIFVIGWFIRMVDPIGGVFMSIYYIAFCHLLYKKEEKPESLGLKKSKPRGYLSSILYVPLQTLVFIPIFVFLPMIDDILPVAWELSGQNFALMVFVAWLVVGTFTVYAEEIFFRGFTQDALEDILNVDKSDKFTKKKVLSMVSCSILFGISHLNVVWADLYLWGIVQPDLILILIGLTCITIMGFLLSLVRLKTDSLWPAMVAHSIGNFFMVLIPSIMFLYGLK